VILGDSRLLGEAHGEAEGSEAHAPHAMPHAPRACFLEIRCSQAGIPGQLRRLQRAERQRIRFSSFFHIFVFPARRAGSFGYGTMT
jgi:hypothetical protein